MRTPSLTVAARRLHQFYGRFLVIMLGSSTVAEKSPEILTSFQGAQDAFGSVIDAQTSAEEKLVEASAFRARAHRRMARGLRDFAYVVLARVQEDRTAPLFRAYFPDGYGRFGRMGMTQLIEAGEAIVSQLAQVPNEELDSAGQELASVIAEVKATEVAYQAAKTADLEASHALRVAKRPWRDAYRACFHALSAFHSEDPREAETYFRQFSSARGAIDPTEGEVPEDDNALVNGDAGAATGPVVSGVPGVASGGVLDGASGAVGPGALGASGAVGGASTGVLDGASGSLVSSDGARFGAEAPR